MPSDGSSALWLEEVQELENLYAPLETENARLLPGLLADRKPALD